MRTKEAIRLRILELCTENQMTLNALSGRCGITQSTLNNIVSGRNNSATIDTIHRVCGGLEISLPDFFNSHMFMNIEQEIH